MGVKRLERDRMAAAAAVLSDPATVTVLPMSIRQTVLETMATPKPLQVEGSSVRCYVHSSTEEARLRKFREPWTREWLCSLPDNAVLYDVGANIGIMALLAAEQRSRHVQVVAIEPAPANFASLVKNIALNQLADRVYPLPVGVGARTAILPLKLTTYVPGGAMHAFGDILQVDVDRTRAAVGHHYCLCWRLDDLVGFESLPFPTHIKIDVDGGEWDVLAGARRVLSDARCRGVQIEVADIDGQRSARIRELMAAAGFVVVARHPRLQEPVVIDDYQFAKP